MDNKINIGASAQLALAPIFIIFFILISNSNVFALTAPNTIEAEDIENIIDYIYSVQDDIYSSVDVETRKATIDSIKQNVVYSNVANTWNTYINTTSMPYMENITITFKVDANYLYIYMTPSNNTIGDIAPFPKVQEIYGDNYNNITLSYVDSNGEKVSVNGNYIRIDKNGTIEQSNAYKPSTTSTYLYDNIAVDATNSTCYVPFMLGLNTNTKIYFRQGDKSVFSWYINENKINTVNRVIPEVPEEPEPEQPTTSGEYGSVLDDINTGIGNINNELENIKNNMTTSGEIQNIISGEIEKIQNTIAGEYSGDISISSGEILESLGYNPPKNPNESIWDTFVNGLQEALTSSGNVTLKFEFHGKEYAINSNDIKQPESALKTYTALFINFIFLMQMISFIKKCYDEIAEGDLKVLSTADADCYFF